MDFIERIFHLSPDGGSGITEMGIILAGLSIYAVRVVRKAITVRRPVNIPNSGSRHLTPTRVR